MIKNSDHKIDELPAVTRPRPGHADLAGVLKYHTDDARNILERASARETAARVAAGALAKIFLLNFNLEIFGYVKGIGGINSDKFPEDMNVARNNREISSIYCIDPDIEDKIIEKIKQTGENGDSLGVLLKCLRGDCLSAWVIIRSGICGWMQGLHTP